MSGEREHEVGLAAVLAAARLCETVRAEVLHGAEAGTLDKADRSPVTVADFGSQALVCRSLREAFPDDAVVAEEASRALRQSANAAHLARVVQLVSTEVPAGPDEVCAWIDHGGGEPGGRYWTLDPIDGTKGFLRNDQYAIALALIEAGDVRWGFLACPALPRPSGKGVVFAARRGGGCETFDLAGGPLGPVRVSRLSEPARARLAESVESGHTDHDRSAQVKATLGSAVEPLRMDSQAKYGAVARGEAEMYLRLPNPHTPDYRENIWDHAAGWLVVEEAGGRVSDAYGRPFDWTRGRRLERNAGVVATNGRLHEAVLAALAPLLPA